jgi:hypothetical protein
MMSPDKNNLLAGPYYYYEASLHRTPDSYRDDGPVRYSTPKEGVLLLPAPDYTLLTAPNSPFTIHAHEPLTRS